MPQPLEISLLEIGLRGADTYDQSLSFAMRVRARVVMLEDGREAYSHEITHMGARRSILEWAKFDARQVRQEVDRGYRRLADNIVNEVFLLWSPTTRVKRTRGPLLPALQ